MTHDASRCDLDPVLAILAGKWKPLILYHLSTARRRYGELRRAVGGATDKVLIDQLKELEADGVIERTDHDEVPPHVEYGLSPLGAGLTAALAPAISWSRKHPREVESIMSRRKPRVS